ncbi:MAG: AAA family ATPase [Hyphomonadaceae bacterium]|nr:AAA family ATPase [Hyphomonadaceae bacterium]
MVKPVQGSKQLSSLQIDGYKSIKHIKLDMGRINVLIGANGAGKSNFIGFFRTIQNILDQNLQTTVGRAGGPDAILHFGRKVTQSLSAELYFGNNGYRFTLEPTSDNRFMFSKEALWWNLKGDWGSGAGHFETRFAKQGGYGQIWTHVVPTLRSWRVYHFHDTSSSALVKQIHSLNDNLYLRDDASNLASFLLRLREHHREQYDRIVKTVRLVAPFFGDFLLRPTVANSEKIQLEWTERGKDMPFTASELSDGTLRFICLATVLLQPEPFMPDSILIDEPELGLHPFAISVLAALMKSAAVNNQLIVSTQSVELVNEFDLEDLIVVDKRDGASTFTRPDPVVLGDWLNDYSLGDLWKKNILGGRPGR